MQSEVVPAVCTWVRPPSPNAEPLSQPGQHPTDSGDPAGPGAADTQGDRQQQREKADAEHQCRLPVAENPHPAHGRGEAQQGERGAGAAAAGDALGELCWEEGLEAVLCVPLAGNSSRDAGWDWGWVLARSRAVLLTVPPVLRRRPSSSRRLSTSSPWSRRRPGYYSRTPSSSGSSRWCSGRWEGGTVLCGWGRDGHNLGGAQSITASPWGLGETPILITAGWRCFTASWQARGADGGIESVCCPYPQEAFLFATPTLGWPWGFRPPHELRATRVALGMDLGLALPTPGPR